MINVLAILSGILLIGPTFSLIVDMFDKVYAGNYFFHYALTVSLGFGLAGPNALNPFLGDCFLWGMAGLFVCLAHVTVQTWDIPVVKSAPIIPTEMPIYIPPAKYHKPSKPGRRLKRTTKGRSKAGWVYLLRSADDLYKIGHTITPNDRIRTFGVKLPFDVEYEHLIQTDDRFALETELHHKFAKQRVGGEWFVLSDEDVEYIKSL